MQAEQKADTDQALLEPVFAGSRQLINILGVGLWLATLIYFWTWWLQPVHIHSLGRFAVVTLVLVWITLVPAYFIFIFAKARVPVRSTKPPRNARIAMVVTKAPSEPFSVVKRTLLGALAQKGVNHDTWLADEDPKLETLEWCRQNGVNVSSRKGVIEYHRHTWPRRTKCKEGNLAYFYDHYGYDRYDFVSQLDADHVPSQDYLQWMIAPFADPGVGYVSAPSICDSNAATSWSARGRLYVEASMHGALQAGYNSGWAPLCIGSHYTVRTSALRSVGGLGPELAEDHSTTLILNAGGWKGVHAVNAIAHGLGPATFSDLAVQEFQWARSLVTILLEYSPTYLPRLRGRVRFQFVFSQLWYPLFSAMMGLMFVLPIFALATGKHFANVTYVDFFLHILPMEATLLVLAYWWRSTGLFRPPDAKVIGWEGIAFLFLRWPWSLMGCLAAVWDRLRGIRADFQVTPKGAVRNDSLPYRIVAPYVLLAVTSGMVAWLVTEPGTAGGFYIFNLVNAATYGVLLVLVLYRHSRENALPMILPRLSGVVVGLSLLAIAIGIVGATYRNGAKGLAAVTTGIGMFALTETVYPVAGAGAGPPGRPIVRLKLQWRGFSNNGRARNVED